MASRTMTAAQLPNDDRRRGRRREDDYIVMAEMELAIARHDAAMRTVIREELSRSLKSHEEHESEALKAFGETMNALTAKVEELQGWRNKVLGVAIAVAALQPLVILLIQKGGMP